TTASEHRQKRREVCGRSGGANGIRYACSALCSFPLRAPLSRSSSFSLHQYFPPHRHTHTYTHTHTHTHTLTHSSTLTHTHTHTQSSTLTCVCTANTQT